jgi:hypothetical protein
MYEEKLIFDDTMCSPCEHRGERCGCGENLFNISIKDAEECMKI